MTHKSAIFSTFNGDKGFLSKTGILNKSFENIITLIKQRKMEINDLLNNTNNSITTPNQAKQQVGGLFSYIFKDHSKDNLVKEFETFKSMMSDYGMTAEDVAKDLGNQLMDSMSEADVARLYDEFAGIVSDIRNGNYTPEIILDGYTPVEFSSVHLSMYSDKTIESRDDISKVLDEYFYRKSAVTRIRQKSSDLRKIVSNAIERTSKKYDLQLAQLKDTESREKYRVYGELINTYGYNIEQGADSFEALNYYTNEMIKIPLDKTISVMDNSKRYFARYNKLKRTYEALTQLTVETKSELEHLQSVQTFLDMAIDENSLAQVKEELVACGYVKGHYGRKGDRKKAKSKPLHYISSDGFHMYVGKNNIQNDELTFKFANGGDMWFHAKKMPGSHVIVRLEGAGELPDSTYEEAARLAAYYSSGRTAPKVEIDYTERRNIKKPAGAKPGFVIYHTNYSMIAEPRIAGIEEVQ